MTLRSNSSVLPPHPNHFRNINFTSHLPLHSAVTQVPRFSQISFINVRLQREKILAPGLPNQCHYYRRLSCTQIRSPAGSRGGQTALRNRGQVQVQGRGSKVNLPGKWAQLCSDVGGLDLDVRSVWTGDQS